MLLAISDHHLFLLLSSIACVISADDGLNENVSQCNRPPFQFQILTLHFRVKDEAKEKF